MAQRKRWQSALAGLGKGIGDASELMLRQGMQDRYDEKIAKRQTAAADRQFIEELGKFVTEGGDPAQAIARAKARNIDLDPAVLQSMRPTLRRRLESTLGQEITKADKPEMIPDEARMKSLGEAEGAFLPDRFMVPDAYTDESDPFAAASSPELEDFRTQAQTKRRALENAPTQTVSGTNAQGQPFTQMKSRTDLQQPFVTGPTPEAKGSFAAAEDIAHQTGVLGNDALTTLKGTTEARLKNLVEGLTRQGKVQTAAAITGAEKRAGLAPDIVAAEVDKAHKLSEGKENSTESERRAATNWAPLVKAHATALDLEKRGARFGTGDVFMTKVPLANRLVPELTKQYMQAARDFNSTLGLIRSGVTVRPDEAESLIATMFGTTGDDDRTLLNKQHSREVFLASMQAMVGRSGDEAGRILGAAINNGQIPASVLQSLQFDNPSLKKALLGTLKGVPVFDLNGNPIDVRKP